jgi:hypothetical protein
MIQDLKPKSMLCARIFQVLPQSNYFQKVSLDFILGLDKIPPE